MKSAHLGDEYDGSLRHRLGAVLRKMGAAFGQTDHNVVGSQELTTTVAEIDGQHLTIEAETYIGLTISGDEALVDAVASAVRT